MVAIEKSNKTTGAPPKLGISLIPPKVRLNAMPPGGINLSDVCISYHRPQHCIAW